MPILDLPVKELEKYEGRNPKPVDFDEYWEKAIAEMKAVDPQVTLQKAVFQTPTVECYDMYFTGVNGARIYVKHLRPKNIQGKIPAVLRFHGYSGESGDWYEKLGYAASGIAVFAMDCRGQGGKSEDAANVKGTTFHGHIVRGLAEDDPQKLMFRDIFLDTAELARIVMDMDFVDEARVYAAGGSQGGALTIACASLEPRIAKAAPIYPFLCDYKRVWEMDLAVNAYEELKTYFRNYDPRHEREDEIFTKLGYIDLQYLAPRIKADVWMFTGLMDDICPPSTQYAAYNKMTCKKKHILYPDFGHEWLKDAEDIIFDFFVNGCTDSVDS
ncbi:MAG: alpha/beta fold hydrolase [Blautia sp.]|nr:acetylxylan esterase [Blautia sp.]MDY3998162.1 alpha/beta fold hydrolase [Blautia sp.]